MQALVPGAVQLAVPRDDDPLRRARFREPGQRRVHLVDGNVTAAAAPSQEHVGLVLDDDAWLDVGGLRDFLQAALVSLAIDREYRETLRPPLVLGHHFSRDPDLVALVRFR